MKRIRNYIKGVIGINDFDDLEVGKKYTMGLWTAYIEQNKKHEFLDGNDKALILVPQRDKGRPYIIRFGSNGWIIKTFKDGREELEFL